jgi:hypothetical protein
LYFAAVIYFIGWRRASAHRVRLRLNRRLALAADNTDFLTLPKRGSHEDVNTPLAPTDINTALPVIKGFFKNRIRP